MPPARTIIVDTATILRNIAEQAEQQRLDAHATAADKAAFWLNDGLHLGSSPERRQKLAERDRAEELARLLPLAPWVPRNLESLAGKPLTSSERIRHQQAMRALEVDGFVELEPRHVRLTDAGRAAVEQVPTS